LKIQTPIAPIGHLIAARPVAPAASGKFLPALGNYFHHPAKFTPSSARACLWKGISQGCLAAKQR
jgi:hypothetical protein